MVKFRELWRTYGFDEVAISAYWCGHYKIAKNLGEKILREKRFPAKDEARFKKNLQYTMIRF